MNERNSKFEIRVLEYKSTEKVSFVEIKAKENVTLNDLLYAIFYDVPTKAEKILNLKVKVGLNTYKFNVTTNSRLDLIAEELMKQMKL